ncbi:MAG: RNA polymerase sigma-70 factor [Ferruginibacter sp.]
METLKHNDAALLAEIKRLISGRDDRAIEWLFDHYYDKLVHFAQSFVSVTETAEEIVDDIILKLWNNPLLVSNIENLPVYLYKSVKNECISSLRKKNHTLSTDFSAGGYAVQSHSTNPLEDLVLSEMNQALQVAVDSLPPKCRLIFRLIREDGLAYKEVAEILGISVNTIDNQMAIAVKRICAAIGIGKNSNNSWYLQQS